VKIDKNSPKAGFDRQGERWLLTLNALRERAKTKAHPHAFARFYK
jgi:hypothetical protein